MGLDDEKVETDGGCNLADLDRDNDENAKPDRVVASGCNQWQGYRQRHDNQRGAIEEHAQKRVEGQQHNDERKGGQAQGCDLGGDGLGDAQKAEGRIQISNLESVTSSHKSAKVPKRQLDSFENNLFNMTIEAILTRELEITFIDARAIAVQAKLALGV